MNIFQPFPALVPSAFAAFTAILLTTGLATTLAGAEPAAASPPPTNAVDPKASSPTSAKPQITGAELYSIHCNRCHPERYPTERTAAQWKTIMLHMQVRASIPGKQARLILKYLQENSGR
jgi:mono/diheme cytochrome c family protein